MKWLIHTVLVLVSCAVLEPSATSFAQPPGPASAGPDVAEAIKQVERDWVDAMIHVDLARLNQIVADDWVETGGSGKIGTKASFLDDVRSGAHKLETCDLGPADVKVLGNVAVLSGSATETRLRDGQPLTVHVGYMDVYVKRGDRWVVIRSHASKI
jgi:ketosteroid isomerase-like protein